MYYEITPLGLQFRDNDMAVSRMIDYQLELDRVTHGQLAWNDGYGGFN
jgi:hypothetical protein